jgi:peroxiredoxin
MTRDFGTKRRVSAVAAAMVAGIAAAKGSASALPGSAGAPASATAKLSVTEPEDRKAAPAFALPNAAGREIALDAYRGEVVVLNFWATWCHGCKQELPWFVHFEKQYGSRGMTVIGASTDADGWKSVKPYLAKKPLNYPVVIADQALTSAYGLGAMPMTVLIDRQGRVAATYNGVVDRAACDKAIQALLREPAAGP